MNINDELKRTDIDTFIAFVFIIASLLNIKGDQYKRKYLYTNNDNFDSKAKEIYIFVQLITICACLYFVYRNQENLKTDESNSNTVRLIGSILILIGTILVLIALVSSDEDIEPSLI